MKKTSLALFAIAILLTPSRIFAGAITWNGSAGDSKFTTPGNWIGSVLPGTADDAYFTNNVTAPSTVEVNAAITVGGLEFIRGFNTANTMTLGNGTASPVTMTFSSGTAFPLLVDQGSSGSVITFQPTVNSGTANLSLSAASGGSFNVINAGAGLVINSPITGLTTASLTKNGSGMLQLGGSVANTQGNMIVQAGTLKLDLSGGVNKLNPAQVLQLAGGTVDLSGGTFTQNLGSFAFGSATNNRSGAGFLTRSSGTSTINLKAMSRNASGYLDIATAGIATTTTSDVNGILFGGSVTLGGTDWAHSATATGGVDTGITAYTGYTDVGFGGTIANASTSNVRLTGGASGNIALGAATTLINTLKQDQTTATTIDTAGNTLRLGTIGGVFMPPTAGPLTIGTSVGSGFISGNAAANVGAELQWINNSANDLTVNAKITNNGTGIITNIVTGTGPGIVIFAATGSGLSNAYSGPTVISGTTLSISADSCLGTPPIAAVVENVVLNGGTLRHTSTTPGGAFLTATRGIRIGPKGGTIDIPSSSAILLYTSGQITALSSTEYATLTKSGAGTLRVTTPTALTFAKLKVTGGLYQGATDGTFCTAPSTPLGFASDIITLDGGGISANAGFTLASQKGITLGSSGGRIDTSSSLTYAGVISGSGALTKTGTNNSSTLTLSGASTYTGGTTLQQGVILAGGNNILGTGAITLSGSGEPAGLNIRMGSSASTARSFTNAVVQASDASFGDSVNTGALTFSGSWTLSGGSRTIDSLTNTVTISGAIGDGGNGYAVTKTGTGTLALTGANTYGGDTTNLTGTLSINATGTFGNGVGTLRLSGGTVQLTATRALAANILNPVVMSADTTLRGDGSFLFRSGGTWSATGGTLTLTNGGTSGATTFDLVTSNAFTFAQPIVVGPAGETNGVQLTMFNDNVVGDQVYNGVISGTGSVRRSVTSGTGGNAILNANNLYTGVTTVSSGTLTVNGSIATSSGVTVSANGTLSGIGTTPAVTLSGTLSPGPGTSSLSTGSETWNGGSTNNWEINDFAGTEGNSSAGWDVINIAGGLTINATAANRMTIKVVSLNGGVAGNAANFNNTSTYTKTLVHTTTGITGFDSRKFIVDTSSFSNSQGSGGFRIAVIGNDLVLQFGDPAILTDPADVIIAHAGTTNFSVSAASAAPTYQWRQGGVNLSNGPHFNGTSTATLTITGVQDGDDIGGFDCVVTGASGSQTSASASLTIVDPPVVTANPAGLSIGVGTNATFTVSYTGTSNNVTPMTFRWKTNGVNLVESAHFVGTASPTLTVVAAVTGDAASYSVSLTNANGTASSGSGILVVDTAPVITTQPFDTAVAFGDVTNFTVVATGPHLTYQWQTNGVPISDDAHYIGTTSAVLTITNAVKANEATNWFYRCVIANAATNVISTEVKLVVATSPVITSQPHNSTFIAGNTNTLFVVATGPQLNYFWRLNGSPLTDGVGHVLAGANSAVLTLGPISQADAGSYSVVITNFDGTITSSDAAVTVIDPIVITGQPTSVTINSGQNAALTVTASGTSPSYQWKRGGVNLSNGGHVTGATTAALSFTGATQTPDMASYSCIVSNFAGAVTSGAATLTVNEAPAITTQPTSQTAAQTGSSATFSVVATGYPLNYQWYFNNSTIPNATNSSYNIASVATTNIGYYYVIISNPSGSVQSSTVQLRIGNQFFSDALDADTSANWHTNTSSADNRVTWAYDYLATAGIPQCPGSSTTKALKLEANLTLAAIAAVSLSPNSQNFTGDYQLRFNLWMNFLGPAPAGGTGGTESFSAGIATSGDRVMWAQSGNTANGVWVSSTGDGNIGTGANTYYDYGIYTNASAGAASTLVAAATGIYAGGTSVTTANDNASAVYTNNFGNSTIPAAQTALFATQTGACNAGALAFQWHEVILNKSGNVVSWLIDGIKIASVTNAVIPASGTNISIGYLDPFASVCADPNVEFGLFSNLKVESFSGAGVAPSITSQPQNTTVNAGSAAVLNVTASSPTTLRYQWQKNNVNLSNGGNISGATTAHLTISGALATDAGNYHVLVFNDTAPTTSADVALTVNDPAINVQPASTTVALSAPAVLNVGAAGTGTLTYQWRKATVNLSNGANISGANSSALTIVSTGFSDADSYDVIVTGSLTSVTSSTATITVQDPGIVMQPVSLTRNAGQDAVFSVAASGTGALTYSWRDSVDAPISNGGQFSGADTSSLTIHAVSQGNVGSYHVVVTGTGGNVTSSSASLTVIDPPVIGTQPASVTKNAGVTATFTVSATGTAPFTYQWRKNGSNLSNGGKVSGATNTTLSITNVLGADRGSYSIVISNPAGSATSSDAILSVVDPLITAQPNTRTNNLGDNATFSVTATGTTALSYQWKFNGTDISGATASSYARSSITATDAGTYSVVVSNSVGTATSTDALLVIPYLAASKVAQWNFNSITPDANTITGNLNPSTGSGTLTSLNGVSLGFSTGSPSDPAGGTDNSTLSTTNYSPQGTSNKTAGVQFTVSTVGWSNISVSWEGLNNGGASKYTRFQYTSNGVDWTDSNVITKTNNLFVYETVNLAPLTELNNNANVGFRLVSEFESTAIGNANANYVPTSNATYTNSGTQSVMRFELFTVMASVAPTITSNPTSVTKEFGDTANFSVSASGGTLSYQWTKNGTPLTDVGNISGAITSTLTVSSVAGADDGSYACVVSNSAGSTTSDSATLVVHDPAITAQPADTTVECGSSAVLNVSASGTPALTYQWYTPDANGTPVPGGQSSSLTVNNVHGSTAYVVVVGNGLASTVTSSSATVTASDTIAPSITVNSGPSTVCLSSLYSESGSNGQ